MTGQSSTANAKRERIYIFKLGNLWYHQFLKNSGDSENSEKVL